jgi:hypothetical protein
MGDIGDIDSPDGLSVTYKFQGNDPVCGYSPCRWAGIYWSAAGGYNLVGATQVDFSVKGTAGARIKFYAENRLGQRGTCGAVCFVTLTGDWQTLTIPLTGADLSRVTVGFGWATAWSDNPGLSEISFVLKDIWYR